jgi:hypothetical protein
LISIVISVIIYINGSLAMCKPHTHESLHIGRRLDYKGEIKMAHEPLKQQFIEDVKLFEASEFKDNEDFHMENFLTPVACGTVGCAAGYIYKLTGRDYYDEECLTEKEIDEEWKIIDWFFSGRWARVDNTKEGFIARVICYIKEGVPDNYRFQIHGRAPLSYRTPKGKIKKKYRQWPE